MKRSLRLIILVTTLSLTPVWGNYKSKSEALKTSDSSIVQTGLFQNTNAGKKYYHQISPRKLLAFWLQFPDLMFDTPSETEWQLHAELKATRERINLMRRETELKKQLDLLQRN